jgi:hypothetical protein
LIGVVGVPRGVGANFRGLTLAVFVTVVEHTDQRKFVNQITPVLVLHQLAEYFSSGLQLALAEMLLPTNHKDHIFDNSVVELFLRRVVDRMRKVDTGHKGTDVPMCSLTFAISIDCVGILDAAALMIWLLLS